MQGETMSDDLRVLIVEDDFHVAKLHVDYVSSASGFVPLNPVGTVEQALLAAKGQHPDLILLDVYLPDASGLDLLQRLDHDALVLTAASDAASVRLAFRRGALGYLIKPFSAQQLTDLLRGYVRYRRLLAADHSVDQDMIERSLRSLATPQGPTLRRTRSATEAAVLQTLKPGSYYSTLSVARAVGISRATAQRYLSALVDDGTVEMRLHYGGTGRPEHQYGLAE